jgi:hypothetical protein
MGALEAPIRVEENLLKNEMFIELEVWALLAQYPL